MGVSFYDAYGVIAQASGPALSFTELVERYHRRIRFEAVACLYLPRITRRFRERWWLHTLGSLLHTLPAQEVDSCIHELILKNEMYGSKQLYMMDTFGIMMRTIDKFERIKTIDKGVKNELLAKEGRHDSVRDTFNYAVLAILVIRRVV